MPSPVGHFLGGVIAGLAIAPPPAARGSAQRAVVRLGLLGVAPDVDFLFGAHSTYSHSIGAAAIVGAVAWTWGRPRWWVAAACAAAWGSHVALDWLGTDMGAPIGIMALWPFDNTHHLSSLHWFLPIHRAFGELSTWTRNLRAILRELLLLGPLALGVFWVRRRQSS